MSTCLELTVAGIARQACIPVDGFAHVTGNIGAVGCAAAAPHGVGQLNLGGVERSRAILVVRTAVAVPVPACCRVVGEGCSPELGLGDHVDRSEGDLDGAVDVLAECGDPGNVSSVCISSVAGGEALGVSLVPLEGGGVIVADIAADGCRLCRITVA